MCRWCPFAKHGQPNRPVFGEGQADARGIIFAESPGHEEASRHRLLVGATGQEFDRTLLHAQLQRSKLYVVNVIACIPQGPKSTANMQKATECCRPLVLHQIKKFGPAPHVLTLGSWAYYSLMGTKLNLRNGRGFLREWTRSMMEDANTLAINKLRKAMEKFNARSKPLVHGSGEEE